MRHLTEEIQLAAHLTNGRWYLFDLVEPGTVDQMLAAIDRDTTAIFWG